MKVSTSSSLWALLMQQQESRVSENHLHEHPRAGNMICLAAEVHDRIYRGQLENFSDIAKELQSIIATQIKNDRENRQPTRYVE